MRKQQLWAMIRLTILLGGVAAYSLGAAMGFAEMHSFDWGRASWGLLLTVCANLVAHYADEYADVDTDSLTRRTWLSGGSGVLPEGLVPLAGHYAWPGVSSP